MTAYPVPTVRAVRCDHRAPDDEVYEALRRATAPLTAAWERIRRARTIAIKMNQAFPPADRHTVDGVLQELVDAKVARATLRLLREANPSAAITCVDTSPEARDEGLPMEANVAHLALLREFDVALHDADQPPHVLAPVPGGGLMFASYLLPAAAVESDAFVSVAKMKSHAFMGITLCCKNLFGLPPMPPLGRARQYLHAIIRLPYVLADLGRIVDPALNIVDGLVGQSGREWFGEGLVADTLVAGDQVIATDVCAGHLMGADPLADWPAHPYLRDRNHLRIAAEGGFGTVDLARIDFASEVTAPVAPFRTRVTDAPERIAAWRRTTCEQALHYRDHRQTYLDHYAKEFILLQDGEVRWRSPQSELNASRRELAGPRQDSAMWLKYVDPEEAEGEHFEVYERELARMQG